MSDESQTAWEQIAALQEFLSGLRKNSTPFPSVDYWLREGQKETVRVVSGNPTKTTELPDLIAACPCRSSLKQIEAKLEDLQAIATDFGLDGLAEKIGAATKQAHHEVKTSNK